MQIVRDQPEMPQEQKWRKISWNGVSFDAPANWDIGEIDRRYLLLETDNSPRLELKWGPVKGKYSPRGQLKRLAASQSRIHRRDIREDPLPADWAKELSRYKSVGFHWRCGSTGGRGIVLYCAHCRQATLLQFHQTPYPRPIPYAGRLLASFSDHGDMPLSIWSVFDIRAKVPNDFHLKTFRFDVGHYELIFQDRTATLTLHRWGPADALLGQEGLMDFAKIHLKFSANRSPVFRAQSSRSIESEDRPPEGLLSRLQSYLRRQPHYRTVRLWHEADKNRILGVRLDGRKPFDIQRFRSICAHYGTIWDRTK